MQVFDATWDVTPCIDAWHREFAKVAFVPTMGNLHDGHLQLVDVARQKAERVVVSVYVNPLQFGYNEDFAAYPRTLAEDLAKLEAHGVDLVFTPTDQTMYPHGVQQVTVIQVPASLSVQLEGAHRPGHFTGVATIVSKLFHITKPDLAIFGEKDLQQLRIIQQMVRDLNMPIEIHGEPTVREPDGLAMSSRNQYLDKQQRAIAPGLFAILQETRERIKLQNVELVDLEQAAIMKLEQKGFTPDYVAIRHSETLQEPNTLTDPLVILAAARLGTTRLIDNLLV
jgi:pantoate--beta-alanine ligase